jgi:hypothetical protein
MARLRNLSQVFEHQSGEAFTSATTLRHGANFKECIGRGARAARRNGNLGNNACASTATRAQDARPALQRSNGVGCPKTTLVALLNGTSS